MVLQTGLRSLIKNTTRKFPMTKLKLKRRKPRRRKQVIPSQPNNIPYSKYRIEWVDALSDSGWADDREFNRMKLAKPINEGWLFSKDDDSVKIFASYDLDPVTKDITFGDRTMIPTSWVVKMIKIV
jgi:hypothetical protein|tara:strand:- start:989 stop:1366 length:378 start_codon:yes stop_codon:yes gene_type:complete